LIFKMAVIISFWSDLGQTAHTKTMKTLELSLMRIKKRYAPNLEQDFWAHAKEAIYNTKRENHRHAIDVPIENLG